jgi:mono/diheme cytochrome c family protein
MHVRRSLSAVFAVVLALVIFSSAQEATKEVKKVPIKQTSANSGPEMYKTYCAVCHGVNGKGDGPAAPALKVSMNDLSTLAQRNGGKYPALKVAAILRGDESVASHGSKEMPIWGKLFWGVSGGSQAEVQQRIANLNRYVESLQAK